MAAPNQAPRTEILFPVGRYVQGDLYTASTTDADGNMKVYKHGPDAGKERPEFYFAVAIAKDGKPWWETEWGQKIFQTGVSAFPQGQATSGQKFAWKVRDGDDQAVNSKGKRNCDREGFPGHWIVGFSSGFPPEIYDAKGAVQLNKPEQKGLVKRGYYVQVFGNVAGNGSLQQPGIFLNYKMVAFAFAGTEISSGPDAAAVGFGQGTQRPAGAVDAPAFAANPYAAAPGAMPGQPAPAAMPTLSPGQPAAMPGMPTGAAMPGAMPGQPAAMPGAAMPGMPAPVAVTPHAGYMAAPGASAAPGMPGAPAPGAPAAPAAPAPAAKSIDDRRTATGIAYTFAQWVASGWTEAALIASGHLLPY